MVDDGGPRPPRWRDPAVLRVAAYTVVTLAGAWWLGGQLAGVLRPLLLAVLLSYVLLPYYSRLRRNRVPAAVALVVLAGAVAALLTLLAVIVAGSLMELSTEVRPLKDRAVGLVVAATEFVTAYLPWLTPPEPPGAPDAALTEAVARFAQNTANQAAGIVIEAATTGLYLLFLLLGAEKLPDRVRAAYPPAEADAILHVAGRVNSAIVSYLKAKVKASLVLAVPAAALLAAFDVRFALLWGVLTFLCNFIPYVGSVIAYSLPVAFAFLQYGWGTPPVVVAVLLLGLHVATATLVEPLLIGKAVGLSPLVILAALAVWGSLWGLPGMFLAVPLTAVVKLVLENIDLTRPVAKLAED